MMTNHSNQAWFTEAWDKLNKTKEMNKIYNSINKISQKRPIKQQSQPTQTL